MMRFNMGIIGLAGFLSLHILPAHASQPTLHYEPAVVQLSGTVQLERHYGPPNYGASPRSDSVLTVPVLVLDAPFTVQGNPPDPRNGPSLDGMTFPNVARVQLTFPTPGAAISSLSGRHFTVRGTLFEKISAQNYTDVLLSVEGLAPSVRTAP